MDQDARREREVEPAVPKRQFAGYARDGVDGRNASPKLTEGFLIQIYSERLVGWNMVNDPSKIRPAVAANLEDAMNRMRCEEASPERVTTYTCVRIPL
jgi:hypothetical protein